MRRKLIVSAVLVTTLVATSAAAAAPELSITDRLDDRRYVASGTRAYSVGTEAGRFPAMGFHTRGEMGGVWTHPLKLVDGVWFAVDGEWVGPATRFASGWGYVEMDLPTPAGLRGQRVEFAPDGRRALLIGLRLTSTGAARDVPVSVDAHSELLGAYPWGETTPSQLDYNLQDEAAVRDGRLEFREQGTPPVPNAEPHDWAAVVGAREPAASAETGAAFRGPQDLPVICPPSGPNQPPAPPRCDDTAYGKGAGGQLRYELHIPAGATRTLWIAVAGSESGPAAARSEADAVLADPEGALRRKVAERVALSRFTRLSLPGDPLLAEGIDWNKQMLADSVQIAEDLEVRETNAGRNYPPPEGELDRMRLVGPGWPDFPWLFATDGEYTAFASVAVGQFEPLQDHLRALRDVSEIDNGDTGKVVHEVASEGAVFFGSNADPGNTDETVKFPSALALMWRWTGDDRFRDDLYPFARRGMRTVWETLDEDGDGWPEGLGNVERPGMGEEKLDVTVYAIRGLLDLADMARARGDDEIADWAEGRARTMQAAFEGAWWMPEVPQHADSLRNPTGEKSQQRHWIGVTPMEAELVMDGVQLPGLTTREHGNAALDLRETDCYGDEFGLWHTGAPGCDGAGDSPSEKQAFTLNTAVMATGEGNYGRLGADQQQRFTTANRQLQLPEPDEQPGAMPEIAPAPALNGRSIDRPFNERPSVLQAWGAYGTAWPVVHQHLGVRPDLGRGRLEVTPQLPPHEDRIAGRNIRLGDAAIDVVAARGERRLRTVVDADLKLRELTLGHTLPLEAEVEQVLLDGRPVKRPILRETNRGLEVLAEVRGKAGGRHVLVVKTG